MAEYKQLADKHEHDLTAAITPLNEQQQLASMWKDKYITLLDSNEPEDNPTNSQSTIPTHNTRGDIMRNPLTQEELARLKKECIEMQKQTDDLNKRVDEFIRTVKSNPSRQDRQNLDKRSNYILSVIGWFSEATNTARRIQEYSRYDASRTTSDPDTGTTHTKVDM